MKKTQSASANMEFWFDFGSNYSYLSIMRIEELANKYKVNVLWKPFLLGPIFRSFGWETSPFVLQKQKGIYVWNDMAREARKYGIPWKMPSVFPRLGVVPLRVCLVAAEEPWVVEFNRRVMLLNFAYDQDINSVETIARVLEEIGQNSAAVLREAQSDANKQKLREQTEEAASRGIFGGPTFFIGTEMFWGNDRLEDALEFATAHNDAPAPLS